MGIPILLILVSIKYILKADKVVHHWVYCVISLI